MRPNNKTFATDRRCWLLLALACWGLNAVAVPAGVVSHLSGPLFVQGGAGTVRTLAVNSVVEEGDTLVTEKNTYARLKLKDGAEIVLRPASQLRLVKYAYEENRPESDAAVLDLVKGGLRTVTGLIGKRGDRAAYRLEAVTATIGIRGTIYGAQLCQSDCEAMPDGLYVDVEEGAVSVGNSGGLTVVVQGETTYVGNQFAPPSPVPRNFTPFPSFTPPPSVGQPGASISRSAGSCLVR